MKKYLCILFGLSLILSGCGELSGETQNLFDESFAETNSDTDVATGITDDTLDSTETDIINTSDNVPITDASTSVDSLVMQDTANLAPESDNTVHSIGETVDFQFCSEGAQQAVNAKLTVNSITRGDEAKVIVDSFNAESADIKIDDIQSELLEFAVLEYTLDLTSANTEIVNPVSTKLNCVIKAEDGGDSIHYNGKVFTGGTTQYVNTDNSTIITGSTATGRIIYTVPKGCTQYQLRLGDETYGTVQFAE